MGWSDAQPPFDHRKVPESAEEVESDRPVIGCLVLILIVVGISMLLYLLGGTP